LFHRAVAQSGHAAFCRDRAAAERTTEALLTVLDLRPEDAGRLAELPSDRLLDAQFAAAMRLGGDPMRLIGPFVDGELLPRAPLDTLGAAPARVPLLIGANGDEDDCAAGVTAFADQQAAAGGQPVFVYRFAVRTTAADINASCHGLELPFVFANVDCPITDGVPDRGAIASTVSGAWAAFARTGHPEHAGLPAWPAYSTQARSVLVFDRESRVENSTR
jgi:para-nitrobenzyl esterase